MDIVIEGITQAFWLLVHGDPQVIKIGLLSLLVSGSATIVSLCLGIPLGSVLGLTRFPGRQWLISLVNTGMGSPPVVVGLIVTIFLWRNGPLGVLHLLYTPSAMIIAQIIIALPVVSGFTMATIQQLDPKLRLQILGLGASRLQMVWLLLREARLPLLAAIMAGFSLVRGDIVITLDADLQNPPEEIPRLVRKMAEGNFDVVGTIRRGRKDSLFRILPSKIVNMITRKITGVKLKDWGCMLRAYRRPVVERMLSCHEHATFIPALATYFGKQITEIEVAHEERHGGKSNYPLRKLINLQFDLVASFSDFPLKLLLYGGVGMALIGVVFGFVLAVARLSYGATWAAEGVFTLFAVLFLFVGMQFFALGLIGEYIGRIYREVRKRPEYVIERVYSVDNL